MDGREFFDRVDAWLERRTVPVLNKQPLQSRDIGVVVQGPVHVGGHTPTAVTLASVRRHLPDARIVLSTWEGQGLAGLDTDDVVESVDPGGLTPRRKGGKPNNVNRQLVSTAAGLAALDTTYALKLRSDAELFSSAVLRCWGSFPDVGAQHASRVFDQRVVISTHYTRYPARVNREMTYHPSDVAQVGTLPDLKRLWAAPLFDDIVETVLGHRLVVAEQWYWLSCLARAGSDAAFDRRDAVGHSRATMAANFVILPPASMGLVKESLHGGDRLSCYSHADWRIDNRRLAGVRRMPPAQSVERWLVAHAIRVPDDALAHSTGADSAGAASGSAAAT